MPKVFKLVLLPIVVILLMSCGSKKNPTGGPQDLDKPVVLTTLPAAFGQLDTGRLEITFSKPLDRASVAQAVYIYPPVLDKKVSVERNALIIRINEDLLPDTNYYVTLTTRLKDTRGNALAENQTLVFAHGELQKLRLSGNFAYEDPADSGLPVSLTLLSADSLVVLNQTASGSSYALETLNPASYILRGYIDKDRNGRYDFSREPYFEERAALDRPLSLDAGLAYADTTKPVLRLAQAKSNRELELLFTEPLADYGSLNIYGTEDRQPLSILLSQLKGVRLTLLTEPQNKLAYTVELRQLRDPKGNLNPVSKADFRASPNADTTPPRVTSSNPRNGTSVSSLRPLLELRFSELIPRDRLQASLRASEGQADLELDILQSDSDVYQFQPSQALQNYRSYVLTVKASDISGNTMQEEYKLNFLPLLRSE